jgi:hypothetical protein
MPSSTASSLCLPSAPVPERNPKAHHVAEPMPEGFATWAAVETVEKLAARYQRSPGKIRNWRAELGLSGRAGFDVATATAPAPRVSRLPVEMMQEAANWLRKVGGIRNVFRCNIALREHVPETWGDRYNWARRKEDPSTHLPDHGAGHFMVDGFGVVTEARVLELARERGFPA